MGGASTKLNNILKKEEVDDCVKFNNNTLEILFNKFKDIYGNIKKTDLEKIFEVNIDQKLLNIIFEIFSQGKKEMNYENFKYLFAMFNTINNEAKVFFISETIFRKKVNISHEKYSKKIELYSNSIELFPIIKDLDFVKSISINKLVSKDLFNKKLIQENFKFLQDFEFLKSDKHDSSLKELINIQEFDKNKNLNNQIINNGDEALKNHNNYCECFKYLSNKFKDKSNEKDSVNNEDQQVLQFF